MADRFVKDILRKWKFDEYIDVFEENGIDRESFVLLDRPAIDELIKKVGPRMKFIKNFENLKNGEMPNYCDDQNQIHVHQAITCPVIPEPITIQMPDSSLVITQDSSAMMSTRNILQLTAKGKEILQELNGGSVQIASRRRMVRILVNYLMDTYGTNPTTLTKIAMAKNVVTEFPFLSDKPQQLSYTLWYSKGSVETRSPPTGYLEERLRNVRKKLRKLAKANNEAQAENNALEEGGISLPERCLKSIMEEKEPDNPNMILPDINNGEIEDIIKSALKREERIIIPISNATCGNYGLRALATNLPPEITLSSVAELVIPGTSEQSALPDSSQTVKVITSIEGILRTNPQSAEILRGLKRGELSEALRRKMVRLLVDHLMATYGKNPETNTKIAMARAIVAEFPFLGNQELDPPYALWYSKGKCGSPPTGYLEQRLKNVRKRLKNTKGP